jgi:hypothetical protein
MKKYFALCCLLLVVGFISCKKSDKTDENTLTGKWMLDRYTSKETFANDTRNSDDTYAPGEYLQFDGKGKCTAYVDDELSTTTYELLDNGKTLLIHDNGLLDLPDAGFTIQKLTSSELELYSVEIDNTTKYEITIFLTR